MAWSKLALDVAGRSSAGNHIHCIFQRGTREEDRPEHDARRDTEEDTGGGKQGLERAFDDAVEAFPGPDRRIWHPAIDIVLLEVDAFRCCGVAREQHD